MTVSVDSVRELRSLSGAGIMDCKKALLESNGDLSAAVDWLRAKGLAQAQKKSGRQTAEGLIGVATSGNSGVMVEVNCETDFVSRNEKFIAFAEMVARVALDNADTSTVESLQEKPALGSNGTVDSVLKDLVAVIGENMAIRRMARLSLSSGSVASFLHGRAGESSGRIGVLVGLQHDSAADAAARQSIADVGHKIAMQVAANRPQALTPEDLDSAVLERERAVLVEQAQDSGKPAEVIEKMIEGRLRKFLQEVTLLSQPFVMDTDKRVEDVVQELSQSVALPVTIADFSCLAAGEGIERAETDFAAEVSRASGV